jgi:hypothetical protein
MSIRTVIARLATKVAAVALFACAGSASAADVYVPPQPPVAAPVYAPADPGCASCQNGGPVVRGNCTTCGRGSLIPQKNKGPYQVNLCPGACFGYFQTQWRPWGEVCPYPYIGQGVSDHPRPPAPVINVPRPGGSDLTPPRPLDPKSIDPKMLDPKTPQPMPPIPGGLPPIPMPPSKF